MQELQQFLKSPLFGVAVSVLVLVLGARMSAGWGNALLVVAWAILIVSFFRAPFLVAFATIPRVLFTALFGALVGLAIYYCLWLPTGKIAFSITAQTHEAEYPVNHQIGDIEWHNRYRELRVKLRNGSRLAFEDVDLIVKPNALVAHTAETAGLPGVFLAPAKEPDVQFEKGRSGSRFRVPVELIGTDAGYRAQVGNLPADTSLELIMALVTYNTGEKEPRNVAVSVNMDDGTSFYYAPENHTEDVYGERPSVDWVQVSGTYTVGGRQRTVDQQVDVRDVIGDSGLIERLSRRSDR